MPLENAGTNSDTIIFLVIADSSQTGGPVLVFNLARELQEEYSVHCACPDGWLLDKLRACGIHAHSLGSGGSRRVVLRELRRLYSEVRPHVIHTFGPRGGVLGRLPANPRQATTLYSELIWTEDYRALISPFRASIQLALLRLLDRKTHCTVAVSRKAADFMVRNQISPPEKTRVIYAPVMPMARGPALQEPVIGTMGSLNRMKGTDVLLRALPRIVQYCSDVRCRIAGEGPLREPLGALATELGIADHVEWLGRVAEPSTFFRTLQIYVQPSRNETFGQAAVEAMSAGIPVVGSRAGALPEVIEEGINGVLFATDDHAELADRVIQLLADPAERVRLAAAGVRRAARFTPERMGAEHRKLYTELLAARASVR